MLSFVLVRKFAFINPFGIILQWCADYIDYADVMADIMALTKKDTQWKPRVKYSYNGAIKWKSSKDHCEISEYINKFTSHKNFKRCIDSLWVV